MNKEKTTIFFCKKCKTPIKESEYKCPKCKSLIINEKDVISKKVTLKEYRKIIEEQFPSFLIKKWYHYLFYIIGWCTGLFNLFFWIILIFVNSKTEERYDKFINPSTRKAIYYWGIFSTIILISVLLFSYVFLE